MFPSNVLDDFRKGKLELWRPKMIRLFAVSCGLPGEEACVYRFRAASGKGKARDEPGPFPLYNHRRGAGVARVRCPILRAGNDIVTFARHGDTRRIQPDPFPLEASNAVNARCNCLEDRQRGGQASHSKQRGAVSPASPLKGEAGPKDRVRVLHPSPSEGGG